MKMSKRLKHQLVVALIVLLIAVASMATATFAWYIYQTSAHTTNIKMAVGTGTSLQISDTKDGGYSSSTKMQPFEGKLNPVSTNRITGGFQKAEGFARGDEERYFLLANLFGKSDPNVDYYKTSLYIRANGNKRGVYVSNISYNDTNEEKPISTVIRVGLVVHEDGFYGEVDDSQRDRVREYIFELNSDEHNPEGVYNTFYGEEGHVLDCDKTDGSTVEFTDLLTKDNYCDYEEATGKMTLKDNSIKLFDVEGKGDNKHDFCDPVQIDVYVWMEGCDSDCNINLRGASLENLAISFACENQ